MAATQAPLPGGGALPSKRILTCRSLPLSCHPFTQVLEVTQVGRSRQPGGSGTAQFYTHTPAGGAAPASNLLAALQAAAAVSGDAGGVAVAPAGAAAPGLPPTASAGSFVRVLGGSGNASLPAMLLSGAHGVGVGVGVGVGAAPAGRVNAGSSHRVPPPRTLVYPSSPRLPPSPPCCPAPCCAQGLTPPSEARPSRPSLTPWTRWMQAASSRRRWCWRAPRTLWRWASPPTRRPQLSFCLSTTPP